MSRHRGSAMRTSPSMLRLKKKLKRSQESMQISTG
jgi:hypothetical protein